MIIKIPILRWKPFEHILLYCTTTCVVRTPNTDCADTLRPCGADIMGGGPIIFYYFMKIINIPPHPY